MRVLIIQFVAPGQPMPRFSHDLGVLSALLKAEGFTCKLCPLPGYRQDLLQAALSGFLPEVILVEIDSHSVSAAHRTIAQIQPFRVPVVVCGRYATCRPTQAISIPGVQSLLLGEFDRQGLNLLKAIRDGRPNESIEGVWTHTPEGLVRGPVARLSEDLDSLPCPDRDLFDYDRIVQSTHEVSFKAARGCPQWCAFCVNDWYMDIYNGKGPFVRRRSVANLCDEVHAVTMRYPAARRANFYDHSFVLDLNWLKEFSEVYPGRTALPYRCFVPIASVTPEIARLLAASHCRWVSTQVGSGSRFIREEILSIHTSNERVVEACQILRQAGLSVLIDVFVGSPYESEITFEETLELLRRCQGDEIRSQVFYPTPGTRAAELCSENAWTSGRGEDGYWLQQSVLDMPSLKASQINALATKLPSAVGHQSMLGRMLQRIIRSRLRPKS
jgi:anaerobic magnesium-protoporphyrin IX monomethyl ester cyclase